MSRRRFLAFSGVAAAGALVTGATAMSLRDVLDVSRDRTLPSGTPVLVMITLYGGNDGLNTVIPAGDPVYHDQRPHLAYQPEEVLDLGGGLGLNPGLTRLYGLWREKKLAIVPAAGYPRPDYSHFRSMGIWQTASPDTSVPTGWLGRWLDATGDDPIRAISLEPTLPPMLAGSRVAGATIRPEGLGLPGGALGEAVRMLGEPQADEPGLTARAARSIADLHAVSTSTNGMVSPATDGSGRIADQLGTIAALIRAGVPTRVYSASLGGFDTHADERATQQKLLGVLDDAVGSFLDAMRGSEQSRDVVLFVYSEFGRRVWANASQGTDHGAGGPLFVISDRVRGGLHGAPPDLKNLDDGQVPFTTDFRDVYGTLLERVIGIDGGVVLGDHRGRVDLFTGS